MLQRNTWPLGTRFLFIWHSLFMQYIGFDIIGSPQEREDPAKAAPCWGNSLLRNQFQSLGFDYLVILDFLPVGVKRSIRFASLAGPRLKLGRNTNKIGEKYRNKRYSIHKFIFYHLTKVESIVLYLTPTYISKKSFIVHRQHRQHC